MFKSQSIIRLGGPVLLLSLATANCKPRMGAESDAKGTSRAEVEPSIADEDAFSAYIENLELSIDKNSPVISDGTTTFLFSARMAHAPGTPVHESINRLLAYLNYLKEYDGATSLGHTQEDGSAMANARYLAAIKDKIAIPAWMNNADFLTNITENGSRDANIRKVVDAENAREGRGGKDKVLFMRFAERQKLGSGDPKDKDDVADRSLFFVPAKGGKGTDYAIMFSGVNTVSVIGVDKGAGQAKTYYYDHYRTEKEIVAPFKEVFGNACRICHTSGGFFPVHPDMRKQHDKLSLDNIKAFNQYIEKAGVAHHPVYDQLEKKLPRGFPALDSADVDGNMVRAKYGTFAGKDPDLDVEAFAKKVDEVTPCGECHQDDHTKMTVMGYKMRAAMRPPMNAPFAMVAEGLMPPDNKFTPREAELYAKLLKERYAKRIREYFKTGR